MPHPPVDLPREPYRALAVFFILPLVAAIAVFGAAVGPARSRPVPASPRSVTTPAARAVGASGEARTR